MADAVRAHSPIKLAIQLGHAGRKASSRAPWEGGNADSPRRPASWRPSRRRRCRISTAKPARGARSPPAWTASATISPRPPGAPSASASSDRDARRARLPPAPVPLADRQQARGRVRRQPREPDALSARDLRRGARRGSRPTSRSGRASRPPTGSLAAGTSNSTVALRKALEARGCASIHVSSGGVSPQQKIPLGPGYQVPFAQRVKREVGLPTIAVGLITEPDQAEAIVANGEADAVVARPRRSSTTRAGPGTRPPSSARG